MDQGVEGIQVPLPVQEHIGVGVISPAGVGPALLVHVSHVVDAAVIEEVVDVFDIVLAQNLQGLSGLGLGFSESVAEAWLARDRHVHVPHLQVALQVQDLFAQVDIAVEEVQVLVDASQKLVVYVDRDVVF